MTTTTTAEDRVADAMRNVAASLDEAFSEGLVKTIDCDVLIQMLLHMADELDPPLRDSMSSRLRGRTEK